MFAPGEIIYGFAKSTNPPKNKYLITIYRDDTLNIIASFTTSQARAGVPPEMIHHGAIINDENKCLSYVFEAKKEIGFDPRGGKPFSFPLRTTVTFDYGIIEGRYEQIQAQFENPEVVCKLNESEYIDLIYAMYKSHHTKARHKEILNRILEQYYSK